MLDEIRQQPHALERTLASAVRGIELFRAKVAKKRPSLIVLAARGTSDNAALFGRYLLEIATGIPVSLAAPSIHSLYNAKVNYKDALVVAISQSGESTDTNLVLARARERGSMTLGVTNESSSSLAQLAEYVFHVRAGKERSVAATKTYTGQVLMMYLLAYALGADVRLDDLRRLPEWCAAALTLEPEIRAFSERYRFMDHAVVVGRGLNYSNAFEFALKMMETCYVVAERFSSADFLHGPIAMVEPSFPIFLFAPRGVTRPSMREMLEKLKSLGAETVIVTDQRDGEVAKLASRVIRVPVRLNERFTPIPYIIPAQLFAACLAEQKGFDPDRPRTLTKVTRTL